MDILLFVDDDYRENKLKSIKRMIFIKIPKKEKKAQEIIDEVKNESR